MQQEREKEIIVQPIIKRINVTDKIKNKKAWRNMCKKAICIKINRFRESIKISNKNLAYVPFNSIYTFKVQ